MSTRHVSLLPLSPGTRTITDSGNRARKPLDHAGSAHSKIGRSLPPVRRRLNERGAVQVSSSLNGKSESKTTARDLMKACRATLRPEDSVERAARVMRETHDGSIPVVDGAGRLLGIVSYRDITEKLVAMGASIPHAQVSDCMTAEAFACSAESTLESCLSAMSWHQVKRLPIVDDDHRIIGTVSRSDLACYVCEHPHGLEPGAITDVLWALAY